MTTSDIVAGLSFAVSLASLVYTARGVSAARRATQLQVFDSIFRDIRALDAEYVKAGRLPSEQWFYDFFNAVEYLAFLINRDLVESRELLDFYRDAVIHWHRTFTAHASRRQLDDADCYPEFKGLIRFVKGQNTWRDRLRSQLLRWL